MFSILDMFEEDTVSETSSAWKIECPCDGLQGGRTKGFILYKNEDETPSNKWYCQSSTKHGGILELAAIQAGLIQCMDCNGTGEKENILDGGLFKETLNYLEERFDDEIYDEILNILHIKSRIETPGDGVLISDFSTKVGKKFGYGDFLFYREGLDSVVEVKKTKIKCKDDSDDVEKYFYKDTFKIMKPIRFISTIENFYIPYYRKFLKKGEYVELNHSINQTNANAILESSFFQNKLKRIDRIFTFPLPIIYKNELTFPKSGYDKRFNSWTSLTAPKINTSMSLKDAKKMIEYIFHEFCFQNEQDYINSIACLITPALRGLYRSYNTRTPNFHFQANRERSGKTTNGKIRLIVYEGGAREEPPISTSSRNDSNDELGKKLTSAMISGKRFYFSTNNKGHINSAQYEAILTKEKHSDRKLGTNDEVEIDNEMEYATDGNIGLTMTPDLMNRCIFINLFLDVEDANSKIFKNDKLLDWVNDNRSEILSAIYTLIRNWVEKKCPKGSIPFTSYPQWSEICGGIMEAAGYKNPCVRNSDAYAGVSVDKDTEEMKKLFEICYENKPDEYISKDEIKNIIIKSNDDIFSYFDFEKRADSIKFGLKINKMINRIFSDIKLILQDSTVRSPRWKYKFTKQKSNFIKKDIFGKDYGNGIVGIVGNELPARICTTRVEDIGVVKTVPTIPTIPNKKESYDQIHRKRQFWDNPKCTKKNLKKLKLI